MAVITPNSELYLLKVPLEINDINQLDFANAEAQFNYFSTLHHIQVYENDFTYIRKDNVIRFPANYDDIVTYNYVMYKNTSYSDKWFYAFITNMTYVNDNMTEITIKTDTFQTWYFDLQFKPCMIDREHTNDDTIGANTYPEELELGDMVTNGDVRNFTLTSTKNYIIAEVSQVENKGESATLSYAWASGSHERTPALNDINRGTTPLILGAMVGSVSGVEATLADLTHLYDTAGLSESIVNVYMLPDSLVGGYNEIILTATPNTGSVVTLDGLCVPIAHNGTYDMGTNTFTRPATINGYTPKNQKMLCYPFQYFNISNNSGSSLPYRYEDFSGSISFKTEGTFGVSGSTKAIPQNYKGISSSENAMDYSINGAKYPVCSWKSDSYTNWLTQNSVNLQTEMRSAILGVGIGTLGGLVRGAIAEGSIKNPSLKGGLVGAGVGATENVSGLISTIRQQHIRKSEANLIPDQVRGNLGAGDFVWAKYKSPFTFIPMSIKAEYARICDEFLSQFGYKCNRVKIPNLTGRRNWNYVKTVGCYIEADIPQEDLEEIKGMFDRGITIWHNPLYFADYSQNNDII